MTIGTLAPANNSRSPLLTKHHSGDDAKEFTGASFSGAVFNLSTTVVGAGIMSLPATMKVLGLVPGMLMIVFVALVAERSIEMLVRFSRAAEAVSYGGLMGDAFGRCGRMMTQICVVVNNVGIMIVYMIIIVGDDFSKMSIALIRFFHYKCMHPEPCHHGRLIADINIAARAERLKRTRPSISDNQLQSAPTPSKLSNQLRPSPSSARSCPAVAATSTSP